MAGDGERHSGLVLSREDLLRRLEGAALPGKEDPLSAIEAAAFRERLKASVPTPEPAPGEAGEQDLDAAADFLSGEGCLPGSPRGVMDPPALPQPVRRRLLERIQEIGAGGGLEVPLVLMPVFAGSMAASVRQAAVQAAQEGGREHFRRMAVVNEDYRRAADRVIDDARQAGEAGEEFARLCELRDGVEIGRRFLVLALAGLGEASRGEVWGAVVMRSVGGVALLSAPLAKLVGMGGGLAGQEGPRTVEAAEAEPVKKRTYPANWRATVRKGSRGPSRSAFAETGPKGAPGPVKSPGRARLPGVEEDA